MLQGAVNSMTPDTITFKINEPAILKLADTTPDLDGTNWVYSLEGGKTLSLPRHAAVKLSGLYLGEGEEFSIGRYRQSDGEPAEWVVALTPRTEQSRAAKETAEAERKARESAEATRRNLGGQLVQLESSLHALRKPPISVSPSPVAEETKGTGTYEPSPRPQRRQGVPQAGAVPFNVAFLEVTRFVVDGLKASGEQWNDQAKQDAICSVLISASRQGLLSLWERENA
jgi:hypothetical protein